MNIQEEAKYAAGAMFAMMLLLLAYTCEARAEEEAAKSEEFSVIERDLGGGLWRSTTLVPYSSSYPNERTYGFSRHDYTTGAYTMGTVRCTKSAGQLDCQTTEY